MPEQKQKWHVALLFWNVLRFVSTLHAKARRAKPKRFPVLRIPPSTSLRSVCRLHLENVLSQNRSTMEHVSLSLFLLSSISLYSLLSSSILFYPLLFSIVLYHGARISFSQVRWDGDFTNAPLPWQQCSLSLSLVPFYSLLLLSIILYIVLYHFMSFSIILSHFLLFFIFPLSNFFWHYEANTCFLAKCWSRSWSKAPNWDSKLVSSQCPRSNSWHIIAMATLDSAAAVSNRVCTVFAVGNIQLGSKVFHKIDLNSVWFKTIMEAIRLMPLMSDPHLPFRTYTWHEMLCSIF